MSHQNDESTPIVVDPLPAHRIDIGALADWLRTEAPEVGSGLSVRQFQGGMSNPTYMLTNEGNQVRLAEETPRGPATQGPRCGS